MTPAKKRKMLRDFRAFTAGIAQQYAEITDLIERGNYVVANERLASMATNHARTSLSFRNLCIKEGLIDE